MNLKETHCTHPGRPGTDEYPPFEEGYVSRVPDGDIVGILDRQVQETLHLLREISAEEANRTYVPGKWTIKEAVGHICDTERIMAYRALRIARGDVTPLPGFDQDAYVPPGKFGERSWESLLAEFEAVRRATLALFASLPDEAWIRRGTANDQEHSVRAFAYVIAGHELHHREVLKSRYLSDLNVR